MSSTLLIKEAEYIRVSIFALGDRNYQVHSQSGFSCHELPGYNGFHAVKAGIQDIGCGWTRIIRWRVNGKTGLYSAGPGFIAESGTFVAPRNGAFYCTAQIRFDRLSVEEGRDSALSIYLHLRLEDNGKNPIFPVRTEASSENFDSLALAGMLALKKGQDVSIWAFSKASTQVNTESGFSCHIMGTQKGFHANLRKDKHYGKGWSTLRGWRTWGGGGKYAWGGRPATDGSYTAPEAGYYACTAQVRGDWGFVILYFGQINQTHRFFSNIA